ncbi:IS701 family transposase [Leptothoe sp. PORK10 BA2]|uniref:IS701 family transposase n=1 Tax=Leptothoe sp. PORK10 BA2 TaxID=3110254 RepID=UPI002B211F5B|nr:transposase [Leptothoe sp. PORK10 BA2]MEA5465731.1 transposase [Leptothoe sp. PORK10 BA2]
MEILSVLGIFAPLFSHRVWVSAQVLLLGAILAPGKRTITAILRVMGLSEAVNFQTYHRVLNRAVWSSLAASRIVLIHILAVFAPTGWLVMGLDDTIERRRGQKIAAKGIYRDPVRSSDSHLVKASGLRWLSLQLLVPIPWAQRTWGLPFLTVLAPSERYHQAQGRRHKRLTDWARQMLTQVRRWLPTRAIVVVADSSFATLELLAALVKLPTPVHMVTRLRLDAQLYQPAPPRAPGTLGRPRKVGPRLPGLKALIDNPYTPWQTVVMEDWYGHGDYTLEIASSTAVWYHSGRPPVPIRWVLIKDPKRRFETQALLCTDVSTEPIQISTWFRLRWQVEVTFAEVRAHLGVETQRQWTDKAILRTTPALLALFSIVTALADQLQKQQPFTLPKTIWYHKTLPTFADALALVRQRLWQLKTFQMSMHEPEMVKVPVDLFNTWSDLLCYAA